jgi:hypothetical protein
MHACVHPGSPCFSHTCDSNQNGEKTQQTSTRPNRYVFVWFCYSCAHVLVSYMQSLCTSFHVILTASCLLSCLLTFSHVYRSRCADTSSSHHVCMQCKHGTAKVFPRTQSSSLQVSNLVYSRLYVCMTCASCSQCNACMACGSCSHMYEVP